MKAHILGAALAALLLGAAGAGASPADGKPTIVLVHGAFADGSSWNGVAARLERDGFPVVAVTSIVWSPAPAVVSGAGAASVSTSRPPDRRSVARGTSTTGWREETSYGLKITVEVTAGPMRLAEFLCTPKEDGTG